MEAERDLNTKMVRASVLVSFLLISLSAGTYVVKADSNYQGGSYMKVVTISAPLNRTYSSRFLALDVTFLFAGLDYTLTYSIDGKNEGAIPWTIDNPDNELHVFYKAIGSVALPELSEGSHCLTVTLVCGFYGRTGGNHPGAPFKPISPGSSDYEATWTDTVYFSIDSTLPIILGLSLENETYLAPDTPLNFTVNENTSRVAYSLDGNGNVTLAGNTTLTGLSVGAHNVTVYAWDAAGNTGSSQTVDFVVVEETQPEPEPLPTTLVIIASGISIAGVGLGLLVYSKKRKR